MRDRGENPLSHTHCAFSSSNLSCKSKIPPIFLALPSARNLMPDVYAPVATPVKSGEPVPPSSPRTSGDITRLLREWRGGNASALDEMVPHIYGELRELAN